MYIFSVRKIDWMDLSWLNFILILSFSALKFNFQYTILFSATTASEVSPSPKLLESKIQSENSAWLQVDPRQLLLLVKVVKGAIDDNCCSRSAHSTLAYFCPGLLKTLKIGGKRMRCYFQLQQFTEEGIVDGEREVVKMTNHFLIEPVGRRREIVSSMYTILWPEGWSCKKNLTLLPHNFKNITWFSHASSISDNFRSGNILVKIFFMHAFFDLFVCLIDFHFIYHSCRVVHSRPYLCYVVVLFGLQKLSPFLVCQSTILIRAWKKAWRYTMLLEEKKEQKGKKNLRENSFENFKWPCVVTSDLASEINEFPSCQNVN